MQGGVQGGVQGVLQQPRASALHALQPMMPTRDAHGTQDGTDDGIHGRIHGRMKGGVHSGPLGTLGMRKVAPADLGLTP